MPLKTSYSVYILSNFARTVLYVGITNDLETRVRQHRENKANSFTAKYKCHFLLYYEDYSDVRNAISREKQLKKWLRKWKFELIMKESPELKDLAEEW